MQQQETPSQKQSPDSPPLEGGVGGGVAQHKFNQHLSPLANALRKNAMQGEKLLWHEFQKLRLETGIRFRRQQPIGNFIVDFYCEKHKCVIEIDGISHEHKVTNDQKREAFLKNKALSVLRFTEADVLQNAAGVLETILSFLNEKTPPLTPPSRGGEYGVPVSSDREQQL